MDRGLHAVVDTWQHEVLPPPGGYAPENLIQPLAEYLPAAVAISSMKKFGARKKASGKFHSAWASTEAAISQHMPLTDDLRRDYIDHARELLYGPMHLQDNQTTVLLRLEATALCAFLPVFERRALAQPITTEDVDNIYRSLGSALEFAYTNDKLALETTESPPAQCAQLIVMGFAARIGLPGFIMYPASPREEQSDVQPHNHDNYFMGPHGKVPVQIKVMDCDKQYDPRIQVLTMETIVEVVNRSQRRFARKQMSRMEVVTDYMQLGHLMIKEANGQKLTPAELAALDKASQLVASVALTEQAA